MYYSDKIISLKEIFGTDDLVLKENSLIIAEKNIP